MATPPSSELLAFQEALAGRYSLERELGRGGMGIVFLAQEVRLDRPVALKLLPPEYAVQPTLRERFLREARTAAKLSHPHIVPIFAVDDVDDFVFFAMAHVDGHTLGQRIRERGPVPPREAARIIREVAWALGYAHAQGVVHRDVKPDNILLERGTGRALVTDFGIAQVTDPAGFTAAREVLGTAEFMSPEQASGERVDERSDIYSLGVVAYYMLSGRLPFEGATVAATLAKQITQAAPALSRVAPDLPVHLTAAVDRCLAKEASERFQGAEELADVLAHALEVRREIPPTLRAFVNDHQQQMRGWWAVLGSAIYFLGMSFFMVLESAPLAPTLALFVVGALTALAPGWMLVRMVRELLRSGHGRDELLTALEADIQARREELASQLAAKPAWYDRLAIRTTYGGVTVATMATGAMFVVDSFGGTVAAGVTLAVSGLASMLAAPVAVTALKRRRKVPGVRWLKFWKTRLGEWAFKLGAMGLGRVPASSGGYRPTEMVIGLAADRLFDELPKQLRKQFAELPEVVHTLEAHAEQTRARVKELERILRDVEHDGALARRGGTVAVDKRESIADDVRRAREAAEKRLSEVVAALETIRLDLLRMHAGIGSVESMTVDLTSARSLSADLERLVEAGHEVDGLLGVERRERTGDMPTPQPA